jgi:hypothetical protein
MIAFNTREMASMFLTQDKSFPILSIIRIHKSQENISLPSKIIVSKMEAISTKKAALSDGNKFWYPQRDLNPCRSLERAVS